VPLLPIHQFGYEGTVDPMLMIRSKRQGFGAAVGFDGNC
jgi:hypothetical protein